MEYSVNLWLFNLPFTANLMISFFLASNLPHCFNPHIAWTKLTCFWRQSRLRLDCTECAVWSLVCTSLLPYHRLWLKQPWNSECSDCFTYLYKFNLFNPFWETSLLKTLWEKEKLLVTSNFSFSHSVFYLFG